MNFMNGARHVDIGTSNIDVRSKVSINEAIITVQSPDVGFIQARKLLNKARAVEASQTSDTAAQATKCSPGTRKEIITDISGWVTDPDQTTIPTSKPILWFSGPAGGGKTTIMRNVVDRCEEAKFLVASYFFSSRFTGVPLTSKRPFVATISHRLADNPILERLILQAIHRRPSLFDESLDLQLQKLVVEPLMSDEFRSSELSARKVVIAIDGFDECGTKAERKHLLHLLQTLVQRLPKSICVILASRPEYDIRTAFSQSLEPFTHCLDLTQYSGTEDTRIYMCDEFQRLRKTHPMKRSIPENWPVEPIMNILVDKSSGLFILPSTLMKHLDNPRRNPVQALHEVLTAKKRSPSEAHPLAELDALYYIILHPPETDLVLMRRLLHVLLELGPSTAYLGYSVQHSTSLLDEFLFLPPGSTDITFCDLHSVLSIPSSNSSSITFHHKSMQDYLADPDRSLDMYQAWSHTLTDIILVSTRHLQDWERNPRYDINATSVAALQWYEILRRMFEYQERPKLPSTVLNLDPRIIPQWMFVHEAHQSSFMYDFPRRKFHEKLCGNRLFCLRLCRLLSRIERAHENRAFPSDKTIEEKIDVLPQFCAESGLYPVDLPNVNWRWFLRPVKRWIPQNRSSNMRSYGA